MSFELSIPSFLENGVHFGHLKRFKNPNNPYIYGVRNQLNIINLAKTRPLFAKALEYVERVVSRGGRVLFVGTKTAAAQVIEDSAKKVDMPYVAHRWLGGMLTNYKTIKQSIRRLIQLEETMEKAKAGTLRLGKKEILTLQREQAKLEKTLGGIKDMKGLPDVVFLVDVGYEKIALKEANCLKIPVVGIVDTNNTAHGVDYPIPGNDDARRAIELYCHLMVEAIVRGQQAHKAETASRYKEEFVATDEKSEAADSSADAGADAKSK